MVNTTGFLDTVKTGVRSTVITNGTYLAAGTASTTATVGDTSLGSEVLRNARQEYTEGTSDVVISLFVNSTQGNGHTLREVGLLDASTAGNLLVRDVFTGISKTSSVELWIDIEEQIDVTQ